MRKFCIFLIVFILFTAVSCNAKNKGEYKVEGLNDEIYYKLSGSWENEPDVTDAMLDTYDFSWGTGKWVPNRSIIIDFGAEPTEVFIGGAAYFEIVSAEVISQDKYKLNVLKIEYDVRKKITLKKQGFFIINYDRKDDSIWFENEPGSFRKNPELNPYYKISGPERPKK